MQGGAESRGAHLQHSLFKVGLGGKVLERVLHGAELQHLDARHVLQSHQQLARQQALLNANFAALHNHRITSRAMPIISQAITWGGDVMHITRGGSASPGSRLQQQGRCMQNMGWVGCRGWDA